MLLSSVHRRELTVTVSPTLIELHFASVSYESQVIRYLYIPFPIIYLELTSQDFLFFLLTDLKKRSTYYIFLLMKFLF